MPSGGVQRQIVGSVLVRDEDRFVARAVRNAAAFCDVILASDNGSRDRTWSILQGLAAELPHLRLNRLRDPRASHAMLQPYVNTPTWVFGIDGDEIYDPRGLARLRPRLLAGAYDAWWQLFGNVLNCDEVDEAAGRASGYLAPPCRSMTKLYNFAAVSRWGGRASHRLNGGTPCFLAGYDAGRRLELHRQFDWDDADFRCLHTCFVARSSRATEASPAARRNITERQQGGPLDQLRALWRRVRGVERASPWKIEKYQRGARVSIDARAFFSADALPAGAGT